MTARRHRAAGLALAVALFAGCGDGDDGAGSRTGSATATTTATPTPALTPEATPTTTATPAPQPSPEQALWPPAAEPTPDPLAAARSFVADYIGLARPHLGAFAETDQDAGEVEVFRTGEDGGRLDTVVATVALRRLDGTNWFVTSARSSEVVVTAPEPRSAVVSPLRITGRGRGFEGNVVLQVRDAGSSRPLAEAAVVAGAMGRLEPFEATLSFDPPSADTGAVVATTGSGVSTVDGFAALPVQFGG